jgi:hypothetical protein|tara:strand:- start:278 stop:520 length:243 start_codon:yes stop_codon:yes gene_type:complete
MYDIIKNNLSFIIPLIVIILVLGFFYYKKTRENMTIADNSQKTLEFFIPSDKFLGAKTGYVFKNDTNGIGYYEDLYLKNK